MKHQSIWNMIGNCPDYCNPQFHYDPHLQTKWKFEISTIIIIIMMFFTWNFIFIKHFIILPFWCKVYCINVNFSCSICFSKYLETGWVMYYKKVLYPTRFKKKISFVKRMNDYRLNQNNNFCVESRDHSKYHVLFTYYFFVT